MADTPTAAERIVNAQPVEATRHTAPAEGGFGPVGKSQDTGEKSVPKKVVKGYEIKEGGSDKNILLEPKLRESIVGSLRDRLSVARSLQGEGRPLSVIDMMLLSHGEQAIRGMEQNNFSLQDLSISRSVIYDDLIQKSLATAQVIQDNKIDLHPALKKLPLLGRLFQQKIMDMQFGGRGNKFSTEYTRALHLENRNPQEIQNNLMELNLIRKGVNEALSVTDPLFDENPPSTHPLGDRSRYYYAVLDQLNGPEGVMQQKFGRKSYEELWTENPVAATEALYEANQRAVTEFAREAAKEILTNQKPKVDTGVIEAHATRLEAKPTPEDISAATKKATEAKAAFTEAEDALTQVKSPVEQAEQNLKTSEIKLKKATSLSDKLSPSLQSTIDNLRISIEDVRKAMRESAANLSGLDAQQKTDSQRTVGLLSENLTGQQRDLKEAEGELRKLQKEVIDAQSDYDEANKAKDVANDEANKNGLPTLQSNFDVKKKEKEDADKNLKEKQKTAQSEVTLENKEKATALREWIKVYGKYDIIMHSPFDQAHGSEFTRERVARTLIVGTGADEQVEGAETLREMIFRQADLEHYSPKLAQKMCSDEALARAIIWTYKILPDNPALKDTTGAAKKGRDLLLAVLPSVRNEQFKFGDMLRFIIHEGLKSAEKGNPYLTLSPYFTETQAELKPTTEDTASKEVGTAKIEDNTATGEHILTWEGDVLSVSSNQTHLKVIQNIQGSGITYDVSIRTDEKFFQALPEDIGQMINLPTAVKYLFYVNGHKRTDLTTPIPEWISIGSGTENDDVLVRTTRATDKLLAIIEADYEQAPTMIRRATVNYVLSQSPAERLKILRGLASNILVSAPEGNFSIDFDNYGNFTIKTLEMGAAQELRAFERQLEQAGQQELLATIQSTLGEEIILAQQRR